MRERGWTWRSGIGRTLAAAVGGRQAPQRALRRSRRPPDGARPQPARRRRRRNSSRGSAPRRAVAPLPGPRPPPGGPHETLARPCHRVRADRAARACDRARDRAAHVSGRRTPARAPRVPGRRAQGDPDRRVARALRPSRALSRPLRGALRGAREPARARQRRRGQHAAFETPKVSQVGQSRHDRDGRATRAAIARGPDRDGRR